MALPLGRGRLIYRLPPFGRAVLRGWGVASSRPNVSTDTRGAVINAAIALAVIDYQRTGQITLVQLEDGVYYIETPILVPTGVVLWGRGRDTLVVDTRTNGNVDSADNNLVQIVGTLDTATFNGTVGALLTEQTSALTLAGGAGAPASLAGKALLMRGNNVANPGPFGDTDGASVTLSLMAKVASSGGYAVTLAEDALMRRVAANTAVAVTPAIGARVGGMHLYASGGRTAVGLLLRYAEDSIVDDLWCTGFTRAPVELDGGSTGNRIRFTSLGENNALVLLNSAHRNRIKLYQGEVALRSSAASGGVVRGGVVLFNRPTENKIVAEIHHGTAALYSRGSRRGDVRIRAMDMTPDTAYTSLVAAGELTNTDYFGVCSGNLGINATGEVNWENTLDLKVFGYTTAKSQGTVFGVLCREEYDMKAVLAVRNQATSAVSPTTGGCAFHNADGRAKVDTSGVSYGVFLTASYCGMRFWQNFEGITNGTGADFATYILTASGEITWEWANIVNLAGSGTYVFFGAVAAAMYNKMKWQHLNLNGTEFFGFGALHYSPQVNAAGDVMEYDQSDANDYRLLKVPTGATAFNVIIATVRTSGGYCVGFLPKKGMANPVLVDAAASHGDKLVAVNGQVYATKSAGAAEDVVIGRAHAAKGVGTAIIQVY